MSDIPFANIGARIDEFREQSAAQLAAFCDIYSGVTANTPASSWKPSAPLIREYIRRYKTKWDGEPAADQAAYVSRKIGGIRLRASCMLAGEQYDSERGTVATRLLLELQTPMWTIRVSASPKHPRDESYEVNPLFTEIDAPTQRGLRMLYASKMCRVRGDWEAIGKDFVLLKMFDSEWQPS